jgi:hypothetical protein
MTEFVCGMLGVFLAFVLLALGGRVGFNIGKKKAKERASAWFDRHGCYVCKEKLRFPDDELDDDDDE